MHTGWNTDALTSRKKGKKAMYVKGVNLGNWLGLEKWMSPGLFDGTTAEDEYYLPTQLSKEVYEERIRIHRSEYITERDFTRIKAMEWMRCASLCRTLSSVTGLVCRLCERTGQCIQLAENTA